ncbi:hypothetical protein ACFODL_15600 [Phenylobacterium terrae]|uniref:Uncharacterized protein n=1 Tax=Phenylobacterium terrae TaxID=2665495 RepID=A0ABW4N6Z8_9CAUL
MPEFQITSDDLDTTDVQKWIDFCLTQNACDPAQAYFEACRDGGLTIRQTIYGAIDAAPDLYQPWAMWGRETFGGLVAPEVLAVLSDVVTWSDPRQAATYDIYLTDASLAEHAMLRAKWHSAHNGGTVLFPTIEHEVATGVLALIPLE